MFTLAPNLAESLNQILTGKNESHTAFPGRIGAILSQKQRSLSGPERERRSFCHRSQRAIGSKVR